MARVTDGLRQRHNRSLNAAAWRLAVPAALLATAGCTGTWHEADTPTPIPTARAPAASQYVVQSGDVARTLEFAGRVTPVDAVSLAFKEAGRVYDVFVVRDEWVEAGTVLAQLDVEDLLNRLGQAQVELEGAEQEHSRAMALAEIDLEMANLRLASARAQSQTPAVTIARVSLEQAEAALSSAQEAYDNAQNRSWESLEPYAWALRQAEWNHEVAQAAYDQALQARQSHVYQIALLEQEVERARLALSWLEEGIDQRGQLLAAARLEVARLEAEVDRARLIAPIDGQVLSLAIAPGREIRAFQPVAAIGDPADLEVSAELGDEQLQDVSVAMTATVRLVSRPGSPLPAVVRRLPRTTGPVADQDPAVHIEILETQGLSIAVDDIVRVLIVIEIARDTLWLPPQAIRVFEGRRFVVVLDGTAQRRVDVVVGLQGEERVEIVSGLEQGQVVIAP